ncbi:type III pantothenate kinase [Pseudidiomarina sp. CB1]|uniref:type III pantothenate kinase n=1 Tax=Pseudidiomarina sp. CB1 TaxID=2972484 RepID=UPI002163B0D2|nr:type III pantothenate kinase [Pseudidiomarina sp. CB1]
MTPIKLLIDAGNTRVKTALMDADGHIEPWFNLPYEDIVAQQLPTTVNVCWLSLVGGPQQHKLLEKWLGHKLAVHQVESEAQAFGVRNAYAEPKTLGIDRWLAMLGAYNEQPKATVIIDAGTAITVDWVTADGRHLGGWIAPGVDLMQTAVTSRAPRVFTRQEQMWGRVNQLGTSTPDGLLDGCVNMFAGIVRQAIYVSEVELDWFDFRLLFSGGSTPLLPIELKRRGEHRSELVLQGLALYANT